MQVFAMRWDMVLRRLVGTIFLAYNPSFNKGDHMERQQLDETFLAGELPTLSQTIGELSLIGSADMSVSEHITPASNWPGTQNDPGDGDRYTPGAIELMDEF